MDFKNSFAWLIYMEKLIFDYNNFFGPGYFLTYFFRSEPSTSGLEKTAPPGELEFSSRSNQKNNRKLLMFFQIDLEKNSSSPEGAVFSRPDVPGSEPGTSGLEKTTPPGELEFSSRSNQKNNRKLLMFFQIDLEKNSSSLEGAVFSRPDVPGSGHFAVPGFPCSELQKLDLIHL